VLAQAEARGGAERNSVRAWTEKLDKLNNSQFSAFAIAVVGALLFVSNFFALSGPSVMLVGLVGIVGFFSGACWYVLLWTALRRMRANSPVT
jgi:hypothetical protein